MRLTLLQCLSIFTAIKAADYLPVETPMNWNDAENHCISQGGHLASISTDCEAETIIGLCQSLDFSNSLYDIDEGDYVWLLESCWIGVLAPTDWNCPTFASLSWSDGTTYNTEFDDYAYGGSDFCVSSDDVFTFGQCGFMSAYSGHREWRMADCTAYKFPFICEIDECDEVSASNCVDLYCQTGQELEYTCNWPENTGQVRSKANSGRLTIDENYYDPQYVQNLHMLLSVLVIYAVATSGMLCVYHYRNCKNNTFK